MGIEVWALVALIVILAVYLLPYLVERREMMGRSNFQDRYSAKLRLLDTRTATPARDSTCKRSGHAELFRRRPKVRAMNRPAVRNVRALRTERELGYVRNTHAQARARRRAAARRRAVVAYVLIGVGLAAWTLGLFTALPWWPALLPTALLGGAAFASRRATVAAAAADKRERRRIAELERELLSLRGRRPITAMVSTTASEEAFKALRSREGQAEGGARTRLPEVFAELRAQNAQSAQDAQNAQSAVAKADQGGARAAQAQTQVRLEPMESLEVLESPRETVASHTDDVEAQMLAEIARAERALRTSAAASAPAAPAPAAAAAPAAPAATPAACSSVATAEPAERSHESVVKEPALTTPPQGWTPIQVPAPTYTLEGRAPKRVFADPVVDKGASAPVPARPQTARTFSTPDFSEQDFQPIDFDAAMERRRAAGA